MALTARLCIRSASRTAFRCKSTAAEAAPVSEEPIQPFRTIENNPINHTSEHLNRFYTIQPTTLKKLYPTDKLPARFLFQVKTFREHSVLVREPALEIISYLKLTDYSRPVNKYVLYGVRGAGKTICLNHVLHYGLEAKRLLVTVPWVSDWYRRAEEITISETKEGYYDLPIDGAAWLVLFKQQNSSLLSEYDLRLTKDYVWNPREQHAAGSPLLELIDFGVARPKYSCSVIEAVLTEIKGASTAGKCNTLVIIDGFNALFTGDSKIKYPCVGLITPDKITLTEIFINFTKPDWCNGAVVVVVDELCSRKEHQSHYPRYLLGKEGFEFLDPFLPIEVNNYTKEEFDTVMEYYRDRKWIVDITENGQRELELMTNRNPYKLMRYTSWL